MRLQDARAASAAGASAQLQGEQRVVVSKGCGTGLWNWAVELGEQRVKVAQHVVHVVLLGRRLLFEQPWGSVWIDGRVNGGQGGVGFGLGDPLQEACDGTFLLNILLAILMDSYSLLAGRRAALAEARSLRRAPAAIVDASGR